MNSENKNLSEIIKTHLEQKAITPLRLQQMTGIPERYLEALLKGELKKMPAAPYTRGYIKKIGEALNIDSRELWEHYNEEVLVLSSGPTDRLPTNRFAIKSVNKKWIVAAIAVIVLFIYLAINVGRLIGQPSLTITNPSTELSVTNFPAVNITGQIESKDTLFINDQEIPVLADGNFEKTYALQPGLNNFEFLVKKFLGRSLKESRQVIYQTQN